MYMSLRYLFVDMNSFFASAEQQLVPGLRNRPVAVSPVAAETTCCIAASYEAKRFGIKCGTPVYQARRMCPGIRIVPARPELYIRIHDRIQVAIETCLPTEKPPPSIDEFACRLSSDRRDSEAALRLARQVKSAIRKQVGEFLRASIGIAPNRFLAKVAADMQKPDGLTLLQAHELPQRLHGLELIDFPGIGRRMGQRLYRAGITEVKQLCGLSAAELSRLWGSKIVGSNWWHQLRGYDLPVTATNRYSVGNSHVLGPKLRTPELARGVLIRLLHKAAARLRHIGFFARSMSVLVECVDNQACHRGLRMAPCHDTLRLIEFASTLWPNEFPSLPMRVSVVLADLIPARNVARQLFDEDRQLSALAATMDRVNQRWGAHAVYFAGMHGFQETGHTAIAFNQIPDLELADA
jgi:DNA polymerase-4